jgi:hypothetical protein
MAVRDYMLAIDFSGAGDFTGPYDDVSSYLLDTYLEVEYGRDTPRADGPMVSGRLGFSVNNLDKRFSSANSASPIAGRVTSGRRAKLSYGSTVLLSGVTEGVVVDPNHPADAATFEVLDAWGRPGAEQLSTPLYTGVRTGTAIGHVLDAIGWTGARDIDNGSTHIPYWWAEAEDAATAIDKLVASEGPPAVAYVQGGTFVFRDRHHRITRAASMTSQATFTGALSTAGPGGAFRIGSKRVYDDGLSHIANAATFAVEQRAPAADTVVWSTDDPISLAANDSITLQAQAADPFYSATVAATTDGTVTATLSRTSGRAVAVTLTTGGAPAIVTRIAITATSLPVVRTVKVTAEDAASIATYERNEWPGEVPWANIYDAQAIATRIVAVYAQPRPAVTITVASLDASYLAQIIARQISDRITIRDDDIGINTDYMIEKITHRITKLGVMHEVTFGCQVVDPTQPANAFTFDVAGKGFNDGAFSTAGIDSAANVFRFDAAGQGFNQGVFAS